jgi:hypothetical protein
MEFFEDDEIYNSDSFLPKEQSYVIFYFSLLLGVSAIYAIYKKKYDAAAVCVLIVLTSLNHWKHPTFGLNRNLDMVLVCLAILYIFVRAIILKIRSLLFWTLFILGLALYPYGWYLYYTGNTWLSTASHCVLHICGNSSIILYSSI